MQTSYITSRTHLFSAINQWQSELNNIFSTIRLYGIDSREILNQVIDGLEFVQVGNQYLTTIPVLAECLEVHYQTLYGDLRLNQADNTITGYIPKVISNDNYKTIASPSKNKSRQGRHNGRFYRALNPDDCLWLALRHGYMRDADLFDELKEALDNLTTQPTYSSNQTRLVEVNNIAVEKQLSLALV